MIDIQELARQKGFPEKSLEFVASDLPEWSSGYTMAGRVRLDFGEFESRFGNGIYLPKISSGLILDVGCSRGDTTLDLAYLYPDCEILGIDLDQSRIESTSTVLEEYPKFAKRMRFQVANFYRLRKFFPPSTFTGIFAMNNISHVARNINLLGHLVIAKEFFDALKEGGYLCLAGGNVASHACAVFRKVKGDFESVYTNDEFRTKKEFGDWAKAYGLETI